MEQSIRTPEEIRKLEENLKLMQSQLEEAKTLRIKSLTKKTPEIIDLSNQIKTIADSYFVSESLVIELITGNAVAKRTKKRAYKNPNDPSLTWNGTGKKPDWLENLLAEGYSLTELQSD